MKRVICVLLVACLLLASIPMVYAIEGEEAAELPWYDVDAAVAYARAYWDDGYGQCAQFVNRCLTVGGIVVPNDWDYYQQWELRYWGHELGIYTNPYICAGALLKYLSNYYPIVTDPTFADMAVGDVIFMSTGAHLDGHTGIITGFDGDMPLFTAHNWDCVDEPVTSEKVNFVAKLAPMNICEDSDNCGGKVFQDMPDPEHWSHTAIDFVYEKGLFNGMSKTEFDPTGTMTRAMLATVLWRLAGSEPGAFDCPYTDIPDGSWYESSVGWCTKYGLVDGYGDGLFAPTDPVTREQLATILQRYAIRFYSDGGERIDFASFADGDLVSEWAVDGVQWTVAQGIITGAAENDALWLHPRNNITRAEVAAMLMRFRAIYF